MSKLFRRLFLTYHGILFILFCCFLALTVYVYSLYSTNLNDEISRDHAIKASNISDSLIQIHTNNLDVIADFCDDFINLVPNFKNPDSTINKRLLNNFLLDCLRRSHALMPELPISLFILMDNYVYSPMIDTERVQQVVKDRPWYELALKANKEVVVTDVYNDIFTGNKIITLVKSLSHQNSMLLVDIQLNNLIIDNYFNNIPKNVQVFILDKNKKIIFFRHNEKLTYNHASTYLKNIFKRYPLEGFIDHSQTFEGLDQENYVGYAYQSRKNGYTTFVVSNTSDTYSVFKDNKHIFIFISTMALALTAIMFIRESIFKLRIRTKANILMALGNIYSDIIYINLNKDTFKNYKGHGPISFDMESDKYSDLFNTIVSEVDEPYRDNFASHFSIEAIRHMAKDHRITYDLDVKVSFGSTSSQWYRFTVLFKDAFDTSDTVLCIRSIDMQKTQEIKEQSLLQDAIESSLNHERDKNNFLSAMSHDMRTPINGILGLCAIGKYSVEDKHKTANIYSKIEGISGQLLQIINEILEASNIEAQSKLNIVNSDLRAFLNNKLEMFEYMAEHQEKNFSAHIDIRHTYVRMDEQKLTHILENLISNAFKYSNVNCDITVSVKEIDDRDYTYIFTVKDNGIGMSQEYLKTVFNVYSRENRKDQVEGTGLGMPIVKNLINKMHGTIDIKSKLNEGTTITFALHLAPTTTNSDDNDANIHEDLALNTDKTSADKDSQEAVEIKNYGIKEQLHVLVAEDNDLNLDIVTELLGMHNIKVTGACNGQKAFDIYYRQKSFTFDAILMDMRMPVLDGVSTTRLIRECGKEDCKIIPILALTANTSTEDIVNVHNCGMNAHIAKPIDYDLLIKTMLGLIDKAKAQRVVTLSL